MLRAASAFSIEIERLSDANWSRFCAAPTLARNSLRLSIAVLTASSALSALAAVSMVSVPVMPRPVIETALSVKLRLS